MGNDNEKIPESDGGGEVDIVTHLERQFLTSLHSKEGLEKALNQFSDEEIQDMLSVTMDEEILRYAAGIRSMQVSVAANPHTPADVLRNLSKEAPLYFESYPHYVRVNKIASALDNNPSTPADALEFLGLGTESLRDINARERLVVNNEILGSIKPPLRKSLQIVNFGELYLAYHPFVILTNPSSDKRVIAALFFKMRNELRPDSYRLSKGRKDKYYTAFLKHPNTPIHIKNVVKQYRLKDSGE